MLLAFSPFHQLCYLFTALLPHWVMSRMSVLSDIVVLIRQSVADTGFLGRGAPTPEFRAKTYYKQESIPVGCVPPAFLILEGLPTDPPRQRSNWTETPPGKRPLDKDPLDRDPWNDHVTRGRDPLEGTWDQATRQAMTSCRDPSVDRMTDTYKSISLPQTSIAGGKKLL